MWSQIELHFPEGSTVARPLFTLTAMTNNRRQSFLRLGATWLNQRGMNSVLPVKAPAHHQLIYLRVPRPPLPSKFQALQKRRCAGLAAPRGVWRPSAAPHAIPGWGGETGRQGQGFDVTWIVEITAAKRCRLGPAQRGKTLRRLL